MNYNKKGITLIEVTVSIFIVAFILVGMMRLYSLGGIQSELAKHKMMAVNLAQAEIENLKNLTYEGITSDVYPVSPVTRTVIIDTGETSSTADDLNGTMLTIILAVSEGYKVIVTLSWNDYYGTVNEVLESVITSYL